VKPADGDAVVIAASDVIVYDEDMSGWANGIAGMTIQSGATLTLSTTAGTYYLKTTAVIQNSGTISGGSELSRYPSNCDFELYLNGNCYIYNQASHAGKVYLWCHEPTIKYAKLISASPKAITGISKGTTCTVTCVGHGFSAGDTVYIVDVLGMTELNDCLFYIQAVPTADTFTLRLNDSSAVMVDSSDFADYVSGGYALPSTAEAIGQTQIEIDTDVTTDSEWSRAGAEVVIASSARDGLSETIALSGVASSYLTLASGLVTAKNSTSIAALLTRNIRIVSSSTIVSYGMIRSGTGCRYDCEFKAGGINTAAVHDNGTSTVGSAAAVKCAVGFADSTYCVFDGLLLASTYGFSSGCSYCTFSGVMIGSTYGLYSGSKSTFSGYALCSNRAITNGTGHIFSGGTVVGCYIGVYSTTASCINGGYIRNCTYPVYNNVAMLCSDLEMSFGFLGFYTSYCGKISNCKIRGFRSGIAASAGVLVMDCDLTNNQYDLENSYDTQMIDTLFDSSTECYGYSLANRHGSDDYCFSEDHDQVAGAFRSWTRGGITSSNTSEKPTGRTRSYQSVCESATYPCWHQREILVEAGRTVFVRVWGKADSGTTFYSQLVLPTADPLITGTGTGEWQQTIPADGTWREYVTSWTNSATYPVTIYLRFLGYGVTKNAYSDFEWTFDQPTMYVRW